ncbi:hypothetical protein QVD17_32144 [Tagetes erecta]|uniref:RING-type E3 ubiquitin transferase n=1 Tax=Tagetes erecta TaxID=13708 RepID=A0AAD8K5P4_TARER|nr:hypothetical protein QVD17_32144 [Tagetes erecta]
MQQPRTVYGVPIIYPFPTWFYQPNPVYYTRGLYSRSMEYLDDVAVLNAPDTNTMRMNQQLMHSYTPNQYAPHQRPEDTLFLDTIPVHPVEAYLHERLMMLELEEAGRHAVQRPTTNSSGSGLSEEEISKLLHVYTAQGKIGDNCCICLCEYEKNEKMGSLECGHQYHEECIKRWLLSKNVCPMCRSTALTV